MNQIICAYNIDEEIEQNLLKLNITPIKLHGIEKYGILHPLSYHPDMLCFNLEKNKWIFYDEVYRINRTIIDKLNLEITFAENPVSFEYPYDIGLNAAMFGNNLICNVKYTNKMIIDYAKQKNKK